MLLLFFQKNKNAFIYSEYNRSIREGLHMKIVVIKSPKVLSGILKVIFGIKTEKQ